MGLPDRLQQSHGTQCSDFTGIFRNIEADAHVALRSEVVNLVGRHIPDDSVQRACIIKIAIHEPQVGIGNVLVLVDMIDSTCVE